MKPTFNTTVRTDDWPQPGQPFSARFISNYSQMVVQLNQMLGGGLLVGDNMNACWLTQSCTHNVGVTIANPLQNKSAPKQVALFPALSAIANYTWSYSSSTNNISLTVNYQSAYGVNTSVSASVAVASSVTLSNATATDLTTISLAPGAYDVSCVMGLTRSGTVVTTQAIANISLTTGTLATIGDGRFDSVTGPTAINQCYSIPSWPLTVSATTTVYLVAQAAFSGGTTLKAYGRISARGITAASSVNDSPTVLVLGG